MALESRFMRIWRSRPSSPTSQSCSTLSTSTVNTWFFGVGLLAHHGLDGLHGAGEGEGACCQGGLAGLDLRHVQHVVDEPQKMLAGGGDLAVVVAHMGGVVGLAVDERGEAQDGVHGRADVVAHGGEERAFGATQGELVWQVLNENFVLTLIGGVLGLVLSYLCLWLMGGWLLQTTWGATATMNVSMISPVVFLVALGFCLLLNLLSAYIPAWRVAHTPIVDSLNQKL